MHTLEILESLERTNGAPFRPPAGGQYSEAHRTSSILHDLRSPLSAIRISAEILRSPDLGPEQEEDAGSGEEWLEPSE